MNEKHYPQVMYLMALLGVITHKTKQATTLSPFADKLSTLGEQTDSIAKLVWKTIDAHDRDRVVLAGDHQLMILWLN